MSLGRYRELSQKKPSKYPVKLTYLARYWPFSMNYRNNKLSFSFWITFLVKLYSCKSHKNGLKIWRVQLMKKSPFWTVVFDTQEAHTKKINSLTHTFTACSRIFLFCFCCCFYYHYQNNKLSCHSLFVLKKLTVLYFYFPILNFCQLKFKHFYFFISSLFLCFFHLFFCSFPPPILFLLSFKLMNF